MANYNHRADPHANITDILNAVRSEFDRLEQDMYIFRKQGKEYEGNLNSQIQDMGVFQQKILELERSQYELKKKYEDEIAHLRQQIEQAQAQTGRHPMAAPHVAPPTIGHTSNHFGDIIKSTPGQPSSYGANSAAPPSIPAPSGYPSQGYNGGERWDGYPSGYGYPKSAPSTESAPHPPVAETEPEAPRRNASAGQDWKVQYNPNVHQYLDISLLQTMSFESVACCVKFSNDAQFLAVGCSRVAYIYEAGKDRCVSKLVHDMLPADSDAYIRSVCFSPDGTYLATCAPDKKIRIWDIAKKRIRFVLSGHTQEIYSLDFSLSGDILASGSGDHTARIWDWTKSTSLQVLYDAAPDKRERGVTSVAISPNGRLVATGNLDQIVRVWDLSTGACLHRFEGHKDSVYSVAFIPDSLTLVSGSLDKTLRLWYLGDGPDTDGRARNPCKMTFTGHSDFVLSVACTPDGRWIVSGSKDRSVQFWDPRTGETQLMLQGHGNSVISVAVSPRGRPLVATGSGDERVRVWSYKG